MAVSAQAKPIYDDEKDGRNEDLGVGTQLNSLSVKAMRPTTRPIVTPIYQTAMYYAESCHEFTDQTLRHYTYKRVRTPNSDEAEIIIAHIEHGLECVVLPSGMAAISNTLFCFLRPGDHIVVQAPLYGCTKYMLENYFRQFKIEFTYVEAGKGVEEFRKAVKESTKMFYGEAMCSPHMEYLDVKKLGELGKELKIMTVVDGTLTPPTNQVRCPPSCSLACNVQLPTMITRYTGDTLILAEFKLLAQ